MSDSHLLVVFSSPAKGREREFDEWYDGKHIPEVIRTEGVVSGQRFVRAAEEAHGSDDGVDGPQVPQTHIAIWEIDGDLDQVLNNLDAAFNAGLMDRSDDLTELKAWTFTAITPRVTADNVSEFTAAPQSRPTS